MLCPVSKGREDYENRSILWAAARSNAGNELFVYVTCVGNVVESIIRPCEGQAVTGASGVSTLTAAGNKITRQKSTASGNITSSLLLGKVIVRYLECTSKLGATLPCLVKSKASGLAGLVITKELHGILGLLLPGTSTGTQTWILFLPTTPPTFVELEEGENNPGNQKCPPATNITGTVAGEVTPVGSSVLAGEIIFPNAPFKEIDLTHGIGKPKVELVAFTETAALDQTEAITYEERAEVT